MLSSKRATLLKDLSPHLSGSLGEGAPSHRKVPSNSCSPIQSSNPGPLETGAAPVFIGSKPRRSPLSVEEFPVRLVPSSSRFTGARAAASEPESPKSAVGNANEISFGPFRLFPEERLLLDADRTVRIGSRALDILIAMVERPGELVSKEELMARVWPNLHVEPANLTVHVAALRRLLGDGKNGNRYLINIPGRGYRFVAGVIRAKKQSIPAELFIRSCANNLPAQVMRLVGRDEMVAMLAVQLGKERFLTIVGPGGIGKSSVALAVAEQVVERFDDGVWQIDLARLNDASQISGAIASALHFGEACGTTVSSLVESLRNKRILLFLDNCEHLVEAAASIVTTILRGIPGARVLATSREALRAEGEHRYRLPSLGIPSGPRSLNSAEVLRFSAVELFVRCVTAKLESFELKDDDVPLVIDLCRRLDGMPLAIEFAASLIDTFGIRGIMQHLEDGLHVLTGGYRTAPPRHQTLRSTLDWSYERLSEQERIILRRLSILKGDFTLDQATAAALSDDVEPSGITDSVASLVAKSLISADISGTKTSYRLLETTRAYALDKLRQRPDRSRNGTAIATR
ncbi:ATP-binding protein [Bradyrhizobium canariense]|uniref:Predicted ATPase n=1 Tax=Bradyrhizobium canariense TaxID=255045 RepID=A0A1H1SCF3_9BRAD|nr:winged helix-turn-helix domain-containing protein [Bradyrhizobium canariense]SDS45029.1 Predicted ATPase [Bradyrhizobium canariense]